MSKNAIDMKAATSGSRVKIALRLAVSFGVLAFLLSQLDWQRSIEVTRQAHAGGLLLLLLIYIADRVLMAMKWRQLFAILGGYLGRLEAVCIYYRSNFVGFALPFGGLGPDIVRFFTMRSRGSEPHLVLSSMVMERVIGVIATAVLVVVAFLIYAELAPTSELRVLALLGAAASVAAGVLFAVVVFHPPMQRLIVRALRLRDADRRPRIREYIAAAREYSVRRRALVLNFLLAFVEQLMKVWIYLVSSHALGMPLPLAVCVAVAPLASLAQRLPISYAGIGLREGTATALLVSLGMAYSDAVVLVLTQFVVFVVSLLPGALVAITNGDSGTESMHPVTGAAGGRRR